MPELKQTYNQTQEQNILLIIEDISEIRQLVESLSGRMGDVQILIVGDGKLPGLAELFRSLSTKLDVHIAVEEQTRREIRLELLNYRKAMEEAAATELSKYRKQHEADVERALRKGIFGSGGGAAVIWSLIEFVIRPWMAR